MTFYRKCCFQSSISWDSSAYVPRILSVGIVHTTYPGFLKLWKLLTLEIIKQKENKLHGLSPRANYTDRATAASFEKGKIYKISSNTQRIEIVAMISKISVKILEESINKTLNICILHSQLAFLCSSMLLIFIECFRVSVGSPVQWFFVSLRIIYMRVSKNGSKYRHDCQVDHVIKRQCV
jgi:hypothetical protein